MNMLFYGISVMSTVNNPSLLNIAYIIQNIYTIHKSFNLLYLSNDIPKLNINIDVAIYTEAIENILEDIYFNNINNKSLYCSINNMRDILNKIYNEKIDLDYKIAYNNSLLLFSKWRLYNYDENVKNINIYIEQLKNNLDIFTKLTILYSKEFENIKNNKITYNKIIKNDLDFILI